MLTGVQVADVQNTLVNNMFRFYGSEEQQSKYLPRLAADTVRRVARELFS